MPGVVKDIRTERDREILNDARKQLGMEADAIGLLFAQVAARDCVSAEMKDHALREVLQLWRRKQPAWDSPEAVVRGIVENALQPQHSVMTMVVEYLRMIRSIDWRDRPVKHPTNGRMWNPGIRAGEILKQLHKSP
jgi:hypothetical protein